MCSLISFSHAAPVCRRLSLCGFVACVASVSVDQRAKKERRTGGFLRSPPQPPSFLFLLSPHFSRGQNAENFAPRKCLLRRSVLKESKITLDTGKPRLKAGSDSAFLNEVSNPFNMSALKLTDDQELLWRHHR